MHADAADLDAGAEADAFDATGWIGPPIRLVVELPLPIASHGEDWSWDLEARGGAGAPYTFAPAAPLPGGMTLDPDGRLWGRPCDPGGTFDLAITVRDRVGQSAVDEVRFVVLTTAEGFQIYGSCRSGTVGEPFSCVVSAFGAKRTCEARTPLVTWTLEGELPEGVVFVPSVGDDTRAHFEGTPAEAGRWTPQLRATDGRVQGLDRRTLFIDIEGS